MSDTPTPAISSPQRPTKKELKHQRYPRRGFLLLLRRTLLFLWAVIFWYFTNIAWNLIVLEHSGPNTFTKPGAITDTFVLPWPLAQPDTPGWVNLIAALISLAILFACLWATRDLHREHKAEDKPKAQWVIAVVHKYYWISVPIIGIVLALSIHFWGIDVAGLPDHFDSMILLKVVEILAILILGVFLLTGLVIAVIVLLPATLSTLISQVRNLLRGNVGTQSASPARNLAPERTEYPLLRGSSPINQPSQSQLKPTVHTVAEKHERDEVIPATSGRGKVTSMSKVEDRNFETIRLVREEIWREISYHRTVRYHIFLWVVGLLISLCAVIGVIGHERWSSFGDWARIIATIGAIVISIVGIILIRRGSQTINSYAKIKVKTDEILHLFEKGYFPEYDGLTSLYPDRWKGWGTERSVERFGGVFNIFISLVVSILIFWVWIF